MSGFIQYHFYINGDELKDEAVRKKAFVAIQDNFTYAVVGENRIVYVYSNYDDYSYVVHGDLELLYDELDKLGVKLRGFAVVENDGGFSRLEFAEDGHLDEETVDPCYFLEKHDNRTIRMIKGMIDREFDQH